VAAMLAPGRVTLAVDNQGTNDCIQGITRRTRGFGKDRARRRHAAGMRTAMERVIRGKGPGAVSALKVKAHVDAADPMVDVIAPRDVREGNERADGATSRGMLEHPEELRAFVKVCEGRATKYRAFLAQLARLMISVARRAEDGIKAMLAARAVPETVFGRKRMAQMVDLSMPAPTGTFLGRIPAQAPSHGAGTVRPNTLAQAPLLPLVPAPLLGGRAVGGAASRDHGNAVVGYVDRLLGAARLRARPV